MISCAKRSPREAILLGAECTRPPQKMASLRTRSARRSLAYDALSFMGQAGYSEEADGVLLCTTTWGDDSCSARPSPAVGAGPLPLTTGAGGRA